MKVVMIIIICYLNICCAHKKGLEIEIVNDKIVSLIVEPETTSKFLTDSLFRKKAKNILKYKITNHDKRTYYFNLLINSEFLKEINGISINKGFINFFDNNNNVRTYGFVPSNISKSNDDFWKLQNVIANELEYKISGVEKYYYDKENFVIHPNETLYFESYIYLPIDGKFQFHNARFHYKTEYNAEIIMFSDSTNYKKKLSRTVLQTIKENGYQVYHGIIKSKNKVPIKFID
jgi:hypothetical protein